MTKEEKQLLLQDLCARLPYGVIVRHADYLEDSDGNYTGQFWYKRGYLCNICKLDNMTTTIIESEGSDEEGYKHICDLERSLPYLRPMSSMTPKERHELQEILGPGIEIDNGFIDILDSSIHTFSFLELKAVFDWLNAHHFDYNNLIERRLAIAVTKENNPYN